ncbi:MAG TPA: hypothetical protein VKE41_16000 [Roseiflexaceae bacterium]|nr:hypothetical protein [Roseiflexaceae bacterium]
MQPEDLNARLQRLNAELPRLWARTCWLYDEAVELCERVTRLHAVPPVIEHPTPLVRVPERQHTRE